MQLLFAQIVFVSHLPSLCLSSCLVGGGGEPSKLAKSISISLELSATITSPVCMSHYVCGCVCV